MIDTISWVRDENLNVNILVETKVEQLWWNVTHMF